jgi:hypothetical protein
MHRETDASTTIRSPIIINSIHNAETYTLYDSVVILALPLVTLTPSCLARATISIRFFDETALAILVKFVSVVFQDVGDKD